MDEGCKAASIEEARDEFLQEVLNVLEEALSPGCYASAREALMEEFGEE